MADKQIKFVFEGDTTDLEKALAQVGKQFDKTDKKAKKTGITGAEAAKVAKAGALAAAAAVAALAVAYAATAKAALDLAAKADKIAKSAAAVGASAEEWQKVIGAFELGGLSAEQTEMAIKKLGLRIGQVASGAGGPAADAFAKLGLTWQDLEALPLPERMATIADSVKGLGSQTERAAVLNAIFEESGIQMAGAFAQGGEAIRDAAQQIEDAGLISNKVAKQSEEMSDAVTLAKRAFDGLKTEALAPIIPLITEVAKLAFKMITEFRKTNDVKKFGEVFVDVFLNGIAPAGAFAANQVLKGMAAIQPAMNAATVAALRLKAAFLAMTGQFAEAEKMISKIGAAEDEFAQSIRDLGAAQVDIDASTVAFLAGLDKIQAKLGDTTDAANETSDAIGGMGKSAEDRTQTITATAGPGLKDYAAAAADIAGAIGGIIDQVAGGIAEDIAATEAEIEDLTGRIESATTDRERRRLSQQKQALSDELKERKRAALEAFGVSKALSIAEASIRTAVSVATALSTPPGPPATIPMGVLAGVLGGIQIAAIAAEPPPSFHSGGMVSMGAPDEITARLLRSEAVLSPQGVAAAGGEDGVRDLNRGSGGQQPVISVLQVRSRVVDAMLSDNLRTKQGPLTDALRAARPRALGRHNPFASS